VAPTLRAPRYLRKTHLCDRRWSDNELGKPAEVLRDCCQCELELGTARPTQSQTIEPQDALEMRKQHLNALSVMT
jgi:hypothetical protein